MKTIGIIGGMSWESSTEYYRIINETVKARLGGFHNAQSLMFTVNFHDIEARQMSGAWDEMGVMMANAASRLQAGGADCVILATNTMHKLTAHIEAALDIPFIHIADATAEQVKAAGIQNIGLLGTRFTMEDDFYAGRLRENFDLNVMVPDAAGRRVVHDVIYDELVLGTVNDASRQQYMAIIEQMAAQGAQGVILGCTEITLLIQQAHSPIPVFDTTRIHAEAAVAFALEP
ncbi:MAG: aspartate/glutamate racemase family protein [Chloroflexota bacterium]